MILGAFLAKAPTVIQNEASSIWDVCVMIECAFCLISVISFSMKVFVRIQDYDIVEDEDEEE